MFSRIVDCLNVFRIFMLDKKGGLARIVRKEAYVLDGFNHFLVSERSEWTPGRPGIG